MRWMWVVAFAVALAPAAARADDKAKLAGEFSAKLTIDEQPGGKHFQGVWLQTELRSLPRPGEIDRSSFVIDYRAREVWRGFEGERVVARGTCYHPSGQAIAGVHFELERLRFAGKPSGVAPFLEVGPQVMLAGELAAPAGGKDLVFRSGSTIYGIAGSSVERPLAAGKVTVNARTVVINPKVVTATAKEHIWVLGVYERAPEPDKSRAYYRCK
ncbi:MAG: hypothetical protein KF773_03170 [Deltaproteobacteria bacterium]|nr:hypothetical protein [Deltaproteobacteria bacterium]